jgi:hypothetical protein
MEQQGSIMQGIAVEKLIRDANEKGRKDNIAAMPTKRK